MAARTRAWEVAKRETVLLANTYTFGWSPTPFGVAQQVLNLAWVTACHVHRDHIAELERTATDDERFAWDFFGHDFPEFGQTGNEIFRPLPNLLREIVGPLPFRAVAVDPQWLTSTVVALARGIDADLAFDRLPILPDALQDGGCDNVDVLDHCCQAGEHVRGCWVLDLLLARP